MTPFTDLSAAVEEMDFLSIRDDEPYVVIELGQVMHVVPRHEAELGTVICASAIH